MRLNIDIEQNFVSRFGIDTSNGDLEKAIDIIDNNKNVNIVGLHCHIGRSRTLEAWSKRSIKIIEIINKYFKNKKLKYIDLGSGMFGKMIEELAAQFGDNIPNYEEYAAATLKPFVDYYKNSTFDEKPEAKDAPSNLAILGRYVLTPDIFKAIEKTAKDKSGEIQITNALKFLAKKNKVCACAFKGTRYDIGNKLGMVKATIDFALKDPELKADVLKFMKGKR